MSKAEESFLDLDPSLSSVEWLDENSPCEVHIAGEITDELTGEFETCLRQAQASQQDVIVVVINSTGGCCYNASKIIDILASCEQEVVTCVRGTAMSAAALIFSCGDRRLITPNSSVMLHSVSHFGSGGTTKEMIVDASETGRLNKRMCEILDENTGNKKGFFAKKLDKNLDVYLNAEKAKEWNLATHVGDVKLTTTISVSTRLDILRPKKRKRM